MGPIDKGITPEEFLPLEGKKETAASPQNAKVKKAFKKAKEAEDLSPKARSPLVRQASLREVKSLSEKTEIKKKNTEFWDCTGRKPNKLGGYLYHFTFKTGLYDLPEDVLMKKFFEQYPAVEPVPFMWNSIFATGTDMNRPLFPEKGNIMNKLGYAIEHSGKEAYLTLPDREALLSNWEELRKSRPGLLPLDIISGEGIVGDIEFIEAYIAHDGLLSTGKEFVHDHFYHIERVIFLKLTSGRDGHHYEQEKYQVAVQVASVYKRILLIDQALKEGRLKIPMEEQDELRKHLELFFTSLGQSVDNISASSYYDNLLSSAKEFLSTSPTDVFRKAPDVKSYTEKRYGKKLEPEELSKLWEKMGELTERKDIPPPPSRKKK